jgi:hypothetical protein
MVLALASVMQQDLWTSAGRSSAGRSYTKPCSRRLERHEGSGCLHALEVAKDGSRPGKRCFSLSRVIFLPPKVLSIRIVFYTSDKMISKRCIG